MAKDKLLELVDEVAPGFRKLFEGGGIVSFLQEVVSKAFRSMFDGVLAPFRTAMAFASGLKASFSKAVSWFEMIGGQLARNDCSGILAAARRVGAFFSSTFGPVVDKVRSVASTVSGFFKSIWESVGAPVMDFLKKVGGALWDSVKGFISDIGAFIGRVKSALGDAWTKVKGWLGIEAEEGTDEGGGLWEWIKTKAKGVWDGILDLLQPVMGPLKVVGGVLLALSPAGPVLAVIRAWPHLQRAFAWVQQAWADLNLVVRAKELFANTVLPAVIGAAEQVGSALASAASWVLGMLSRISAGAAKAASALSGGGILQPLAEVVNFANAQFQKLLEWAQGGLRQASSGLRTMFQRLAAFIQPILDVLKRLIAIAVNPFGIPGLLMGSLWLIVPQCLKGPIIDFIVDILLTVLRALPPMPMLGPLFPFVKAAMIGFLEKVKSFDMDRKIAVSNKMAKIVSGGSAAFAFGYLKGLALGVWEAVIGPIRAIADLFELPALVQQFFERLRINPREILGAVESAMGSLDSVLEAAKDLLTNPQKVIDLLSSALDSALSAAGELGATIADQMMSLFEQAEDQIGEMLGKLVGEAVVNVVLTIFTAGGAAAASAISKVAQILGKVARALGKVVRQIMKFLPKIMKFVRKIAGKFTGAGSRAGGILGKIKGFIRRLMARLRRFLRKRRKKGGGARRAWRQFTLRVRGLLARSRMGIAKARLKGQVMRLRARYRRGVRSARVSRKRNTGFLKVKARPKRGLLGFNGKVLMDKPTRWRLGGIAVRKKLKPLKRLPVLLMSLVKFSMGRLKKNYGYRRLTVKFDQDTNEYIVTGGMSPDRQVGKVKAPRPKKNDFTVVGKRSTKVDPLVRATPYAAPRAWPPDTAAVRTIKLQSTRKKSMYVRGHLVSGWLGGTGAQENLTPITREANAQMEKGMEKQVKALLRRPLKTRGVYSYAVRAGGLARRPIRLRAVIVTKGAARVWQVVADEAKLARRITMTLRKKRYNTKSGKWVNSSKRPLPPKTVKSVPPFPEGWKEPRPAGAKAGDRVPR
jgi:phage-related protein